MTYAIIKAEYQTILDSFAAEKQELIAQRQELLQAQAILQKHSIDDLDVYYKIREIEEKVNRVIDDEQLIEADIMRQVNYEKRMAKLAKEEEAINQGMDAYQSALDDGSLTAICPFHAKYLQKAWLKGYDHMVKCYGALGNVQYAA